MSTMRVDGQLVAIETGDSIAAALMRAGLVTLRRSRTGEPRGLFCGIGICNECLVTVDGEPNVRVPGVGGGGATIENQLGEAMTCDAAILLLSARRPGQDLRRDCGCGCGMHVTLIDGPSVGRPVLPRAPGRAKRAPQAGSGKNAVHVSLNAVVVDVPRQARSGGKMPAAWRSWRGIVW